MHGMCNTAADGETHSRDSNGGGGRPNCRQKRKGTDLEKVLGSALSRAGLHKRRGKHPGSETGNRSGRPNVPESKTPCVAKMSIL